MLQAWPTHGHSAPGRINSMKNHLALSGMEPATLWLVAQCHNQLRHRITPVIFSEQYKLRRPSLCVLSVLFCVFGWWYFYLLLKCFNLVQFHLFYFMLFGIFSFWRSFSLLCLLTTFVIHVGLFMEDRYTKFVNNSLEHRFLEVN
jgi:hypothetical protein